MFIMINVKKYLYEARHPVHVVGLLMCQKKNNYVKLQLHKNIIFWLNYLLALDFFQRIF